MKKARWRHVEIRGPSLGRETDFAAPKMRRYVPLFMRGYWKFYCLLPQRARVSQRAYVG